MTTAFISSDVRMRLDHAGLGWATHPAAVYDYWRPLTEVFDHVVVIARRQMNPNLVDLPEATGAGVELRTVPDYIGVKDLFRRLPAIWRAIRAHTKSTDSSVMMGRIPEPLAILMWVQAQLTRRRFVAFVVGDVDSAIKAMAPNRSGRVVAAVVAILVRLMVRRSDAVVYVTRLSLQSAYPAGRGVPTLARSNVRLQARDIRGLPREFSGIETRTTDLISVGNLQTPLKGNHLLIEALALLRRSGDFRLTLVGDGKLSSQLARLARELDVADFVTFTGHVSDPTVVRRLLDDSDVFVLASLSEGLPRALIEAMARGLPCVASTVGGVPELLTPTSLVDPCVPELLAERISRLCTDAAEMQLQSSQNIQVARDVSAAAADDHLIDFLTTSLIPASR